MNTPPEELNGLHIVELRSENVKRLRAVTIRPDGRIVTLGGDNDMGKTSVLQSIEMALGGGDQIIDEPIRRGAKKARVVLDLGDIIVTRTFTKAGSTLVVTGKDGTPKKSPQELLNRLTSAVAFDPFGFTLLKPVQQREVLQGIVKLDFTTIDAARLKAFNERTLVNRDLDQQKALVARLPFYDGAPAEEATSAEVLAQIEEAQAWNQAIDAAETAADNAADSEEKAILDRDTKDQRDKNAKAAFSAATAAYDAALSERRAATAAIPKVPKIDIAPLEAELAAIMAKIKEANIHNQAVDAAIALDVRKTDEANRKQESMQDAEIAFGDARKALEQAIATALAAGKHASELRTAADAKPRRNLDSLKAGLATIEQTNAKMRANKQHADAQAAVRAKQTQADSLTRKIEECDEKRAEILAAAKFPVPGLAFGENGVLLDGLPFSQAGDAEQIRVSVAIAAALNPKIRVMLIHDGSLIGTRKMELIRQLAEEHNLQVWIEVVSDKDDKKSSVVIEDGHVVGQEVPEDEPGAEPVHETAAPKSTDQPQLELPPQ